MPSEMFFESFAEKYPTYSKMLHEGVDLTTLTRGLVMLNHFANGSPYSYLSTTAHQSEDDVMTKNTFARLHEYFYPFVLKPDLYTLAELHMIIKRFARAAQNTESQQLLPARIRNLKSQYTSALQLVEGGFIEETSHMNLANFELLRRSFRLAEQAEKSSFTGAKLKLGPSFTEGERRIYYACIICNVASVSGVTITDSLSITESVASELCFLVESYQPNGLYEQSRQPV